MIPLLALLTQSALAQTFTTDNAILGAADLEWPGYVPTTMGSPAIAHDNFNYLFVNLDYTLMFYETQVGPPTAGCPAGKWGIGVARRLSWALGTSWQDRGPIIEPGDVSYASCVAAHPAVVRISDSPPTWVVYFKAEQDTVVCPTCDRYPGVGRFVFQRGSALTTDIVFDILGAGAYTYSPPDPTPVMTTVAEEMGYPSVVFADGEYHMAFTQDSDVYVASSFNTASFVAPPTPAITAGSSAGGWDGEQLFSPSLVCQGPSDFELYMGGRTFDAYPGVLDQALGLYTTPDLLTYTEDPSSPLFSVLDGDRQMRHLEMTTSDAGAEYGLFYTTPASLGNQVRLAETAGFSYDQLDAKRCP